MQILKLMWCALILINVQEKFGKSSVESNLNFVPNLDPSKTFAR